MEGILLVKDKFVVEGKKEAKLDVPVLLIFFVRPGVFEKVFESVREARPSVLLLWQDGPRAGREDDLKNIEMCRKIAENIDWNCTVYRYYHEENMGCDPSTFLSHEWAFQQEGVDRCIIMEDDRVPSQSFYSYCKVLLDKYEHDERINHICGTNLLGEYKDCPDDYFFAPCGSTTWATWKRVADSWDEEYSYLDDQYHWECLKRLYGEDLYKVWYETACWHKSTGKPYWETVLGMDALLHSRLAIIPKVNMITDIGMTENATHTHSHAECLPKVHQDMFGMKAHKVDAENLKHPAYVVADMNYMNKLTYINGIGRPMLRAWWKVVYLAKCVRYGKMHLIFNSIKRKFKR